MGFQTVVRYSLESRRGESPIRPYETHCRTASLPVIYSLTSQASPADIKEELAPLATEPVVKSSVDKFHGSELEGTLKSKGIQTVIIVGTSAHGAVLHTVTGAAMRGLNVIVPIDGMSADDRYVEQYRTWHLANSPGTRHRITLTKFSMLSFQWETIRLTFRRERGPRLWERK